MFQSTHTMSTGETILIAEMEDSHLLNMISKIVEWAEKAGDEFSSILRLHEQAQEPTHLIDAQRKIYGKQPPPNLAEATANYARFITATSAKIEPYLLEAFTRDWGAPDDNSNDRLAEIRQRWQAAVGRNSALPNPNRKLLNRPRGEAIPRFFDDDDIPF